MMKLAKHGAVCVCVRRENQCVRMCVWGVICGRCCFSSTLRFLMNQMPLPPSLVLFHIEKYLLTYIT